MNEIAFSESILSRSLPVDRKRTAIAAEIVVEELIGTARLVQLLDVRFEVAEIVFSENGIFCVELRDSFVYATVNTQGDLLERVSQRSSLSSLATIEWHLRR